jgi:hypothetical protein
MMIRISPAILAHEDEEEEEDWTQNSNTLETLENPKPCIPKPLKP